MEIILTADVKGLGKEGDVKKVSDGYARNFLFPKKSAIPASKGNVAIWGKRKQEFEDKRAKEKGEKEALASKLSELTVAIKVDAGESGKLFGSVTSSDVVHAISSAAGIDVDKRDVEMPEHIKTVGAYTVAIKLHPEVTAKIKLDVQQKQ
jgi:large subunit ribosomal protein L9